MPIAPPRLAATPDHVRDSLDAFNAVMESENDRLKGSMIDVIPYVHSWICVLDEEGEPQFGPSKFVGYRDTTPAVYSEHFKLMDGRDTERVMEPWLRLVTEADPDYDDLHRKLHAFCARFGTKPRSRCRISILTMESDRSADVEDRDAALVELLVKVCETLPTERRREVARRISRR